MTKLICPDCHATMFGTSTPTERDVLHHALNEHGKNITVRGEHRYRAKQDQVWEALVKENDEAFEVANEEKMRSWSAFEKDGSSERVLEEKGLDKLHATRALLMEVHEDEYGESSEDDHDDDVVGDKSKEANERFGKSSGYAESLRYHQNEETRFLAEERMAAFMGPIASYNEASHETTNAHRTQNRLFQDDIPHLGYTSDQSSSSSSGSSPGRVPDALLAVLKSARRTVASLLSSGEEMSEDGEYVEDDEDYDDEL